MTESRPKWWRTWLLLVAAAVLLCAIVATKHFYDIRDVPWSIVAPSEYTDVATRMAELRNEGRFDDAVELGVQSAAKGKHPDFLFQIIATTYLIRSLRDKDQSGEWAKLAGDYSDKALSSDPKDIANVFNVGVNYMIVGDDLSTGGCEYYRKALSVLEGLSPKLQGDRAETQGRTVRLSAFRKRNEEQLSLIRERLSHCSTNPSS